VVLLYLFGMVSVAVKTQNVDARIVFPELFLFFVGNGEAVVRLTHDRAAPTAFHSVL
jgi:hypothetical protein